ncbi:EEF1A lysine methyltransferase 1 isoform X1 [Lycorma delicatula]|uniref:EEF1A lysine methyltransferase 1 isoform X1 n=1 Tax=Lycorma delicatula TaxID=130591 RepID=UPI003F510F69
MTNNDDEDDIPSLSAESLKALQEFLAEQSLKENKLQNHLSSCGDSLIGTSDFEENWQLSQFWYDDFTAQVLSNEISRAAGGSGKIALISCPTLYKPVKHLCGSNEVLLFEFDKRFSLYGSDFVFYDYNEPIAVPNDLAKSCDVIVLDPPFLSEECLQKTAVTVKFLAKDKIILCTGAAMERLAEKLLGVKKCKFEPRHKNNLANEFSCYANYNFDEFVTNNKEKT